MDLSFQEKSLWLVWLGLLVVFGGYFWLALRTAVPVDGVLQVMPQQVALFVLAVIVLVVLQIVGHVVVAIADRRSAGAEDERDRLIALKGTRNGAWVLAAGVFCALCAGLLVPGNFVFMHVLLAAWVLAQLTETGSQLLMYRRGV